MSAGLYYVFLAAVFRAAGFCLVVYISNQWKDSAYKMLWFVLIMGCPLIGCILWLLFGRLTSIGVSIQRQGQVSVRGERRNSVMDDDILDQITGIDEAAGKQIRYLSKCCGYPVYYNTDTRYFSDGEEYFESLCSALEQARSFIFLEFFLIRKGFMWDRLSEILNRKSSEGIEVKLIYDGFGCGRLFDSSDGLASSCQIQRRRFNPVCSSLTKYINNRDHRKIAVVDGRIAFTGGINLADEYIHRKTRFGFWKDCGIMIEGSAAEGFAAMFLEMWNSGGKGREGHGNSRYLFYRIPKITQDSSKGFVQPFADNPLDDDFTSSNIYLNLIHYAVHYIYLFTPYLILSEEILRAMILAAKNGVDVRIAVPHIPDKKLTFMVTRSYYPPLIAAGVKIYEFSPGFLHSKCCICDGRMAVVGSINLDYRSFFLHFEDGVLLYRTPSIQEIKKDFEQTFPECIEVTEDYLGSLPRYQRILAGCLRLFAPML